MFTKIYSFNAESNTTVMTEAQLQDLLAERRKRGMSDECLQMLEDWHRIKLSEPQQS